MIKTFLTTATGRQVDLLNPTAADIDFGDITEHLAKENRYNGATEGVAYSVAQHLVVGADLVWREHGYEAAGYFLCHDMPEAYLKDDTTPKKRALEAVAADFGVIAGTIVRAFERLTDRWDAAIHGAAGLAWPAPPEIAEIVHRYDKIMLLTEWKAFMPGWPPPVDDEGLEPAPQPVSAWSSWVEARTEFRRACCIYLPALREGFR